MPHRAELVCLAGCDGAFPLTEPVYHCPRCGVSSRQANRPNELPTDYGRVVDAIAAS